MEKTISVMQVRIGTIEGAGDVYLLLGSDGPGGGACALQLPGDQAVALNGIKFRIEKEIGERAVVTLVIAEE